MKYNNLQIIESNEMDRAISFAQSFTGQLAYSIKNDARKQAGSLSTAYHRLRTLEQFGLAKFNRDTFEIKSNVVIQPASIRKKLLESLIALKGSRRFGKYYNESDVNFAKKHLPGKFLTTLDYAAWELTKYQTPSEFFIYVDSVEEAADYLIENDFNEGENGNVILLEKSGNFDNVIERIYLDSIAKGGRSTLDGIALELIYSDSIKDRGYFPLEFVKKVQEDLPRLNIV
ncbi:conserved hypothetical protein [metagenome]